MNTINLSDIADGKITQQELASFVNENMFGFILKTHYDYIGSCQSSIDVMQDHLEMAFICERLSLFSKITKYERNYNTYPPEILATLITCRDKAFLLSEEIKKVSILKTMDTEPDRDQLDDLMSDVLNFENSIEEHSFIFMEEIEDYYANYINQGIYEIGSEFVTENEEEYLSSCFEKHPEWGYGFWKNHLSNISPEAVYFSTFCWIIKNDIDADLLLSKYSGIESISFDDATLINGLIINEFTAINYNSLHNFGVATSFIDHLNVGKDKAFSIWISQNFDIVKISYSGYYIIYFNFELLGEDALKRAYNETSLLHEKLSALLGLSKDISCDWNMLTDESFEELCYDIIYNDIKFDSQKIQKMGKTKSRDGGRDIVVYTKPMFGIPAKKYIIQCKLLKKSSSLTKSMMNNASNVIMEYGADGYIIMTNATIDSALHDMLDGFKNNSQMHVNTETRYSKNELERYLARNYHIKKRYWGSV